MKTSVAYAPAHSTRIALRPAPNSSTSKMLDDRSSEALNVLADQLASSIEALEQAVGIINQASYSDPRWDDRARARLLLSRVLKDVAQVNIELSRPLPTFRANVGTYRPTVRRRFRDAYAEGVEDLRAAALPTWAAEAAR